MNGIFSEISEAIASSREAFERYSKLTLSNRQEIINAIKMRLTPLVEQLAIMTVNETCMGNVKDKTIKLKLALEKTPGIEDLVTEVKTGDDGMILYELSAFGLVLAIHPCTNPVATIINNTIGMLAAGNAIIHIPHPRALEVSRFVVEQINSAIVETCLIPNLVVTIGESSKIIANELMTHPDISMVVATGGSSVLNRAMCCGKKVIGAGPANPVAIVDETANIKKAARDIIMGAAFDNNIMCIGEKCVVTVSEIEQKLIDEMSNQGAFYIDDLDDILKLTFAAISSENTPNKALEGKDADYILDHANIKHPANVKVILLKTAKEHPFAMQEVKMPILPIICAPDFDNALEIAKEIEQGYFHTAIIHSQIIERLNRAAKTMQTAVFVKNGSSLAGIGFEGEGDASFTISTTTGEGTTTARHFARRRRCTLTDGFKIR